MVLNGVLPSHVFFNVLGPSVSINTASGIGDFGYFIAPNGNVTWGGNLTGGSTVAAPAHHHDQREYHDAADGLFADDSGRGSRTGQPVAFRDGARVRRADDPPPAQGCCFSEVS